MHSILQYAPFHIVPPYGISPNFEILVSNLIFFRSCTRVNLSRHVFWTWCISAVVYFGRHVPKLPETSKLHFFEQLNEQTAENSESWLDEVRTIRNLGIQKLAGVIIEIVDGTEIRMFSRKRDLKCEIL